MLALLNWFVVAIPFLVAVGATVLTLSPHQRHYWKVVTGAILLGLAFSGITYWQQVLAARQAVNDRDAAINETSKRVTKEMGDQYQSIITNLTSQIGELKGQLSTQAKDVGIIKSSDFVTGKTPIKVEVTNPSASQQSSSGATLPNLSWTQENAPKRIDDKTVTRVRFRVDNYLMFPALLALCDKDCETVGDGCPAISQATYLQINQPPRAAGILFNTPRPLPPGTDCFVDIASKDSNPVKITGLRILRESELPPSLK